MDNERLQAMFFASFLLGILALVLYIFLPYLNILIVASTFAIVFHPLYRKILAGVKKEWPAAFFTVVIVLLLIFIPLIFFGMQVIKEAGQLYFNLTTGQGMDSLNIFISHLQNKLRLINPELSLDINQFLRQILGWILTNMGAIFSGVTQFIFGFLFSMIAFYYFLKDGERFTTLLIALSPLKDTDDKAIFKRIHAAVDSVVVGTLVVALVQGFLASVGFYVFGVPNAALWGAMAAIAALVPFVGTAMVIIPAVLYTFLTGNTVSGVGLLIWGTAVVGLIDNFLIPKLIGRGTQMHPILILFSVLGGLSVFGPAGLLIGPVVLSLLFTLLDIYKKQLA